MMGNLGRIMSSGTFPTEGAPADPALAARANTCQPLSDYQRAIKKLEGVMRTMEIWDYAKYKSLYPSGQPMMECFGPDGYSTVVREMTSAEKAQYMAGDRVRDLTAGAEGRGFDIMAWIKENPLLVVAIVAGLGYLYYVSRKGE
jgi:hypothetical protein